MVLERALILASIALLAAALVVASRFVARDRLRRLRGGGSDALWHALGRAPDGRPTVVAFSTPGCAACRMAQEPALRALPARVRVVKVDAVARPEVARKFGVLTVPYTVVFDASGAPVAANQGFATTARLGAQLGLESGQSGESPRGASIGGS